MQQPETEPPTCQLADALPSHVQPPTIETKSSVFVFFSYFTPQWPHHHQPRRKHSHSCRPLAPREIPAVLKTIPCHLTGTQGDKASFTRLLTCQEATQKVYVSAHRGVGGFCQVFLHIFYLCEPIYTHPWDRRDLPAYSFKEHSSVKQRSTA